MLLHLSLSFSGNCGAKFRKIFEDRGSRAFAATASTNREPVGFGFTLPEEPSIKKRIRRAARFAGFSVKDFVWRALAGCVNCCEDDMILNPKTGRPIANDVELENFMVKRGFEE